MKSTVLALAALAGVQHASAAAVGAAVGAAVDVSAAVSLFAGKAYSPFSCPSNSKNHCTPEQQRGWTFADITIDEDITIYDSLQLQGGWTGQKCSRQPGMPSDSAFDTGMVIAADLSVSEGISLSIGAGASSFDTVYLSAEIDITIDFVFELVAGGTCRQTHDCKKDGSIFQNTQCGAATSVRVEVHESIKITETVKLSCHKIDWHCGTPTLPTTTSKASSTVVATTTSLPPPPPTTTSTSSIPCSTSVSTTVYNSTSTIWTTTTSTITSCPPSVTDCPNKSHGGVVIVTVPVNTTVCPVTERHTHTHTPLSTVSVATSVQSSSAPAPTGSGSCPDVVPRCMITFIGQTNCKDNTDVGCYCMVEEFVNNMFGCIYANSDNDDIVAQGMSFFQGVCGSYAPKNPCIVTGAQSVSKYITPTSAAQNPSVPTVISGPAGGAPAPVVTVPAGGSNGGNAAPVSPAGTGGVKPNPGPTGRPVTAGAGRVGAGLAMVMAAVAFVL